MQASSGSQWQPLPPPPVPTVPVLTMLGLIGGSRHGRSDLPRTEFPISGTGNDVSSYGRSVLGSIILLGSQQGDFLFLSFLLLLIVRIPLERKAFPH